MRMQSKFLLLYTVLSSIVEAIQMYSFRFYVFLQLIGFIVACIVARTFTEEDDSCKSFNSCYLADIMLILWRYKFSKFSLNIRFMQ
jgi:hypothetical protein